MADSNKAALAKTVYDNLCQTLDKRNWKYEKHDEDLIVTFTSRGNDLPMDFVMAIDEDKQMIRLFSRMPFVVPEDKRMELAIATCDATNRLADGSFDYDITTGKIAFRMTTTFIDSVISETVFDYLVIVSSNTVDEYNDKFFAIAKGFMSLEDFLKGS